LTRSPTDCFHAATWIFVFVGTWLAIKAWKDGRLAPPWRTHIGLLLAGWGSFNLVEGVVDHHVLRVHHVRDDVPEPLPWDLGFSPSACCWWRWAFSSSTAAARSRLDVQRPPPSRT